MAKDGIEFNIHKNILALRSDAFSAALKHPMKESGSSRIEIDYVYADVIRRFLVMIYGGIPEDLTDYAREVYELGDRYFIPDNKEKALSSLLQHGLYPENSIGILLFAEKHNLGKLKREVMEYFAEKRVSLVFVVSP